MRFLELRIPPLVVVAVIALVMGVSSRAFPEFHVTIVGASWLGAALIVSGAVVALMGEIEFRRAGTTVDPRNPRNTTRLVVTGIYRLTRNPMYVGFLIALVGWACLLAHILAFLGPPLFVLYVNRFQIAPEERLLDEKFGYEYRSYQSIVSRW